MDIRQLRYAVAVADEGTFTAAAAACFVAQPSLSQAVQALERELGAPLFHRLGRHVTLTAAGEAFLPAARETLRALETTRAAVAAVAGLHAGHLDLVSLPTLAVDPVTPLIGRFRVAHPAVTVRLTQPEDATGVIGRVLSGGAEVGLAEAPVAADRLVVHRLGVQDVVAVLPPGTPLPPDGKLRVADLARQPLVTLPRGTSSRGLLDQALAAAKVEPRIAVETDQREALIPLVLAGAGASVLPRPMADGAARQGAVVAPLVPPLSRRLALVHRDAPLSPAAAAFVALTLSPRSSSSRGPDRSQAPAAD